MVLFRDVSILIYMMETGNINYYGVVMNNECVIGKRIGIIGECSKDLVMLDYLVKHGGVEVAFVYDANECDKECEDKDTELNESSDSAQIKIKSLNKWSKFDLLIISSEVNLDNPKDKYASDINVMEIMQNAVTAGVRVVNNIELIYMFRKPKTIAITGSYSVGLLGQMISHVLSKFGVKHYASVWSDVRRIADHKKKNTFKERYDVLNIDSDNDDTNDTSDSCDEYNASVENSNYHDDMRNDNVDNNCNDDICNDNLDNSNELETFDNETTEENEDTESKTASISNGDASCDTATSDKDNLDCSEKVIGKFRWPENIDEVDLMVISLHHWQLRYFDVFFASIGIVTNIEEERLEGMHISEYLSGVKHFLDLCEKRILDTNSMSRYLSKDFADIAGTIYIDLQKIRSKDALFKKRLAVFAAHAISSMVEEDDIDECFNQTMYECMKTFTTYSNMQTIFQNDELLVVDNTKATNLDQILHGINIVCSSKAAATSTDRGSRSTSARSHTGSSASSGMRDSRCTIGRFVTAEKEEKDFVKVILLCPEPKEEELKEWERIKSKKYMEKIHGIVLFNAMESKLLPVLEYSARTVNAISFDQACLKAVNMFNRAKNKPVIVMLVGGDINLSKKFQKFIRESVRED